MASPFSLHRLLLFLLLCMLVVNPGCSSERKTTVIAIEKTGSYHRPECPPVHMAKTKEMTRDEATAMKLTPCKVCKPDSI